MSAVVHGIDRYSQNHLCGIGPGLGTDSRKPSMPITCLRCLAALDAQALTDSVVGCLSNVSHLPRWMQAPALGRDTRPVLELVTRAILASDWLAARDAEVRRAAGEQIAHAIEERLHPDQVTAACKRIAREVTQ